MAHPLQNVKDNYDKLCAERDAIYSKVAGLEARLDVANSKAEAARLEAAEYAKQIEEAWGGASWLSKKKEIATLARALSGSGLLK